MITIKQIYKSFRNAFPLFVGISISLCLVAFGILAIVPLPPFTNQNTGLGVGFFIMGLLGVGFLSGFYLGYGMIFLFEWVFGKYTENHTLSIP